MEDVKASARKLLAEAKAAAGVSSSAALLAALGVAFGPSRPPKNTVFLGYLAGRGSRVAGHGRSLTITQDETLALRMRTRNSGKKEDSQPVRVFRKVWPAGATGADKPLYTKAARRAQNR